jgi:hypothetical protein
LRNLLNKLNGGGKFLFKEEKAIILLQDTDQVYLRRTPEINLLQDIDKVYHTRIILISTTNTY